MLNEKHSFTITAKAIVLLLQCNSSNNSYKMFIVETEIQASVNVLSVHG